MQLENAYALFNSHFLGMHPMASLFFFLPLHVSCLDLYLDMHTPHQKPYSIDKHLLQHLGSGALWQVWPVHPAAACNHARAVLSGQALA